MKSIKMALLGGAALAVSAAGAQADDLEALKAQIESLNQRVASMEAAPAIPAGYQLLTVSEGELKDIPGLEMTPGERKRAGNKATVISVLPTADAPVGTVITWSGRVTAGLVYRNDDTDISLKLSDAGDAGSEPWSDIIDVLDLDSNNGNDWSGGGDEDDLDVYANSRLRVTATTDTAVGEVGVTMEMRADMDGRQDNDVYMNEAWGWWAMTPELTFGGGYTASLADIGYGYDGACSCYYIDNADMNFNPGDTTQMRLSYASGPFSMAIALEDSTTYFAFGDGEQNNDRLGVAGQAKYSGDTFSGEISGGWWDVDEDDYFDVDTQWQVGAGVGFSLGEMISFSVAAAMGEGPTTSFPEQGAVSSVGLPINNKFWGVTALASAGLTDGIHMEIAGGYKHREGDDFSFTDSGDTWDMDGVEYDTWAVMGGLYYTPVDQLTIGLEGEYFTSSTEWNGDEVEWGNNNPSDDTVSIEVDRDTFIAAFVGVWRF
jgi:hypothetical protein